MDVFHELGLSAANAGACSGPGGWVATTSEGLLDSVNPATGQVLAQVNRCSGKDYDALVQASQRAFLEWRQVPAPKRGEVVRLIGEALRAKKQALGSLVSMEVGKIKAEGDGEVQEMIDMADFAVGQSRMLYGMTMPSERDKHRMFEQWHPLGVAGVITAFNFPVAVWAWNAFLAAIAGDTVIWKPSPKAPLCALAVQHICNQVMKEQIVPGIFSVFITDQVELAKTMVADERVPLISFTGSVPVGRKVAKVVGQRLGRSLLELSGNNAVIVDETADLGLAIPAIVFGAVGTAGQRCTTTRRVFVQETRYEEVVQLLLHAYRQVKIGNPLDAGVLMGPLIDERALEEYRMTLEEVVQDGGEILYGGRVLDGPGFFVEPTIVRAENRWKVVQRETFAPIVYVIPFSTLDEAIQLQNEVPQGLSSALFTLHVRHAEQFLSGQG
nr:aldehyde dehydrogenase family protein [Nitrospirales bacterium]